MDFPQKVERVEDVLEHRTQKHTVEAALGQRESAQIADPDVHPVLCRRVGGEVRRRLHAGRGPATLRSGRERLATATADIEQLANTTRETLGPGEDLRVGSDLLVRGVIPEVLVGVDVWLSGRGRHRHRVRVDKAAASALDDTRRDPRTIPMSVTSAAAERSLRTGAADAA